MATKEELINGMELVIQEGHAIARRISGDDWNKVVDLDGWKNAQVLAHVSSIGQVLVPFATNMANAADGANLAEGLDINAMNAGLVAAREGKTPQELAQELETGYRAGIEWLKTASDDLLDKRVAFREMKDTSVSDVIATVVVLHGIAHFYSAYDALMNPK
jgi:hypothetical protein